MHDAREIAEWNRMAPLLLTVANLLRDKNEQLRYRDVHPYYDRLPAPPPAPVDDVAEDLSILKRIFVDHRPLDAR